MNQFAIHETAQELIPASDWAKKAFRRVWDTATSALDAGMSGELTWKPKKNTRSVQANACMWAHLSDVSRQVVWHGQKLTAEEWKEVISAGLRNQRAVPGINGGFVVLGVRTSRMSVAEMANMIELIQAFGTEHGVQWTAPAWMRED
ncbi:recombination protein NinB [Chitinimonas sp. PSY-7]|uniref:recombination protein NinB n=1 Tax=Chitinimonas sp. PSY-7 TaxID=3459088 RepID=UPI0040401EC4